MKQYKPSLNIQKQSVPLKLFNQIFYVNTRHLATLLIFQHLPLILAFTVNR